MAFKHFGPNGYGPPQLTWTNIVITLALLASLISAAWVLFQNQFNSLQVQIASDLVNLRSDIRDTRTEVDRLRDRSILRDEHQEFVKRVDADDAALIKRLEVIEATRPTTGEMQIGIQAVKERVDVLAGLIRDIRDKQENLKVARNPVEGRELDAEVNAINKRLDMISERLTAIQSQQKP